MNTPDYERCGIQCRDQITRDFLSLETVAWFCTWSRTCSKHGALSIPAEFVQIQSPCQQRDLSLVFLSIVLKVNDPRAACVFQGRGMYTVQKRRREVKTKYEKRRFRSEKWRNKSLWKIHLKTVVYFPLSSGYSQYYPSFFYFAHL